MKVIYRDSDYNVFILTPTMSALSLYTIDQIAKKHVPHNLPYKFLENEEIPLDRKYRDHWKWDDSIEPDGFGEKK